MVPEGTTSPSSPVPTAISGQTSLDTANRLNPAYPEQQNRPFLEQNLTNCRCGYRFRYKFGVLEKAVMGLYEHLQVEGQVSLPVMRARNWHPGIRSSRVLAWDETRLVDP